MFSAVFFHFPGIKIVSRVSSAGADSSNDSPGFGVYFKHQGIADEKCSSIEQVKEGHASMSKKGILISIL